MFNFGGGKTFTKCSRNGCASVARVMLDWRNPNVHTSGRLKTWAACELHANYLAEFLRVRGFLLGTRPFEGA